MRSRPKCSPRIIRRLNTQEQNDSKDSKDSKSNDDQTYQFHRKYIHPAILMLKNEKDKINYSIWLTRLDNDKSDLKMHLIRILIISLKNDQPFHIFSKPPPKDLKELNLDSDNTMQMVKSLQISTNTIFNNTIVPQEVKYKRFAAVAPDMCSYTTSKASPYLVQSFYVRSDFPIFTWYNPSDILLPNKDDIDHNQWEIYLNRLEILTEDEDFNEIEHNCEEIMKIDQITREITTDFLWHPFSIMDTGNRPKRSIGFIEVDQDLAYQQHNQQNIDETAFNIVHNKTLPGYKMLNPKIYSTTIMPDPNFVLNTTGVKITYKKISQIMPINFDKCQLDDCVHRTCPLKCATCNEETIENEECPEELIPCTANYEELKLCQLKQQNEQKCSLETSCMNNDESVKNTSCNISTKESFCKSDKKPNSCPSKPQKCLSDTNCLNDEKSPKSNMCNLTTKQELSCSINDKTSNICPSTNQNCSMETSCKIKSNDNTTCNIFTTQQLLCSTTTQQNSKFQEPFNTNSNSYKQMNNSENDSRCFAQRNKIKSVPNFESMNSTLQDTFQTKSMFNDSSIMSSTNQISNSFCCNDKNINNTTSKSSLSNQSNRVRNEFSEAPYAAISSLNGSANYDWNMTSNEQSLDQNCIPENKSTCNNSKRSQNPVSSSLNNSSNYDWTMSSNEQSLNDYSNYNWTMNSNDLSLSQNCASKNTNMGNNSKRSQKERKCDHCSSIEPIHQGSQCNNNQISQSSQNSQKTPANFNQSNGYNIQEPYCNSQNVKNSNREYNESYKNKNINLNRKNNFCRQPQLKPRSASVPCNYNKTLPNIKFKEFKPNYKNQNDSCPPYMEYNQYMPNNNINNSLLSATKYLDRNDKIVTCKVDDNWDPDVGSYSEFSGQNSHNDEQRFLTSQKKTICDQSDENSNYSDFSVEIGFNGLPMPNFNSTESLTSNSSYSSSMQHHSCNCAECNPIFIDEYNRNNNQVDGDFNNINEPMNSDIQRQFMNGLQNNSNSSYPTIDEDRSNIKDFSMLEISSDWEDNDSFISSRNHFDNMSSENLDLNNEYEDLRNIEMPIDSFSSSYNLSMDEEDCPDIRDTSFPKNSYDQ